MDLFAGQQIGRLDQVAVDGDAAFVVQFRAGQRGAVDF